jgi:glutathione S-transferase
VDSHSGVAPVMKIYGARLANPMYKGLFRDNRPVWFCEETGLKYERISLDPSKGETKSEAFTKINPFQKIPVLDHDGFILKQSAAILLYLANTTGMLLPKTPAEQAKHLEWFFYCAGDLEPHANHIAGLMANASEADKPHAAWMAQRAETLLPRALDYLQTQLEGNNFLMGEQFYACDILLGCVLYPIREHRLIQERPLVKALLERYYARPAFQRMLSINAT